MEHYICTGGCKGMSNVAKECGAENCPKKGQPLQPCNCEDMTHDGAFDKVPEAKTEAAASE